MNESTCLTDAQLKSFIREIINLSDRIESIQHLIEQLNNPIKQQKYLEIIINLIDEYKILCNILNSEIEKCIQQDRDNNRPVNLTYHKFQNILKKEFLF